MHASRWLCLVVLASRASCARLSGMHRIGMRVGKHDEALLMLAAGWHGQRESQCEPVRVGERVRKARGMLFVVRVAAAAIGPAVCPGPPNRRLEQMWC
jgi:hypothetical protein